MNFSNFKQGEDICDTHLVVVDWEVAKFVHHVGGQAAGVAVNHDQMISWVDVGEVGAVCKLAHCTLTVKQKAMPVDHAMGLGDIRLRYALWGHLASHHRGIIGCFGMYIGQGNG